MPVNKNQLRRLSAIVSILNNCELITTKELHRKVCDCTGENVCKSTIEKDLFHLKMDYDLDEIFETKMWVGIRITRPVDFLQLLKTHLNLF